MVNNRIILISNEPDSFRRITADISAVAELSIGDVPAGIQGSLYLFQNSRSVVQFNLAKYWKANPYNPDQYPYPRSDADNEFYFQIEGFYSFLPWQKTKVKTSSVTVEVYNGGGSTGSIITEPLQNKRLKRYGFRLGISHSKLPVRITSQRDGLTQLRNSKGTLIEYTDEYSTAGTTSLLSIGVQSRKQVRYRYDIVRKKETTPHNTAYVRDLYFDLTYLARLRYADIYDEEDKLNQDVYKDTYSIHVKDNPISPLGFRIGVQALHQGGKHLGIKIGAEFGCRYGINSSSFSFANTAIYYTKFSFGMILLPDPRKS